MDPLHLPTNIDCRHFLRRRTQATPPTNHHLHCHKPRYASRCGASKEVTTPRRRHRTSKAGQGFHPREPRTGAPNRENDTTRATPPTCHRQKRHTMPAARTRSCKQHAPLASTMLLLEETRHSSKRHLGVPNEHLRPPRHATIAAPDQEHHLRHRSTRHPCAACPDPTISRPPWLRFGRASSFRSRSNRQPQPGTLTTAGLANHGQPRPPAATAGSTVGQPWPAMATVGQPRPAAGRLQPPAAKATAGSPATALSPAMTRTHILVGLRHRRRNPAPAAAPTRSRRDNARSSGPRRRRGAKLAAPPRRREDAPPPPSLRATRAFGSPLRRRRGRREGGWGVRRLGFGEPLGHPCGDDARGKWGVSCFTGQHQPETRGPLVHLQGYNNTHITSTNRHVAQTRRDDTATFLSPETGVHAHHPRAALVDRRGASMRAFLNSFPSVPALLAPRRLSRPAMAYGGGTPWASLPPDILLAVFSLLPSDRDRFHAVCVPWPTAASASRPRPGSSAPAPTAPAMAATPFRPSLLPGGLRLLSFATNYLSSSHGYLVLTNPTVTPKAIVHFNPVAPPSPAHWVLQEATLASSTSTGNSELLVDDNEEAKPLVSGMRCVVVEAHLVECGGELLLVSMRNVGAVYDSGVTADDKGDEARKVEVHRVKWDVDDDGAARLVREVAFTLSAMEFPSCHGHPDRVVRVLDIMESQRVRQEETIICPNDGHRGSSSSAGWARRHRKGGPSYITTHHLRLYDTVALAIAPSSTSSGIIAAGR
ncbi:hypothetical protein HU200_022536 [Digitaria exilis]|uniref:F-box domain-containing protein n=1 Tax=Digitaria exilis TaxID=1010633 RepID=A0A835CAB1_9POAL|nr:hypothetical protein HU200_022536 [Digitaria exilis]